MTVLQNWLLKIGLVLAAAAIVYLEIVNFRLKAAKAAESKAKEAAFVAQAAAEGLVEAKKVAWQTIFDGLNKENLDLGAQIERLRRSDPSIQPTSHQKAVIAINDTAKAVESKAGHAIIDWTQCPDEIKDEYGRFVFTIPQKTGEQPYLTRKQQFVFDSVVLKRNDGSAEFLSGELREYVPGSVPSPDTLIPNTGVEAKLSMEFLSESPTRVSFFHPRAVFSVDHRAAVGGGVELVNIKDKVNFSVLGLYSAKDKKADLAVGAGYRLQFPALNTNISPAVLYYPLTKQIGAGITLQLTR